ncbi:MAG: hypothetical protein K5886_09115 [Lachnospiraceae bacterium]|nr:hypothetical protein [Lachnospiraceae bacterium]
MKLLIHDLNKEEWDKIAHEYEGFETVHDDGSIKPCVGCFGCWLKEPGECVIKDGYEKMGALIHRAEEITVISRYTYGGFSSFVKNVFDRSIGWDLPYFEIYQGEMHHKKRYPEDKTITFIFRGNGLSAEDKDRAKAYVEAVCRNFRGKVKDILFEECEDGECIARVNVHDGHESRPEKRDKESEAQDKISESHSAGTVILNCSLRGDNSNSKKFLDRILTGADDGVERINLSAYLNRYDELADILGSAEKIVFGMPLYVDGIPSACLRVMEFMEKRCTEGGRMVYVVANMGLYESRQIKNLMGMVRSFCDKCGFTYGGGIAIGAGEMMGQVMGDTGRGPAKFVTEGLERLSNAVRKAEVIEDIYAEPYKFPRALYMFAANSGWPAGARRNGLKRKDLLRQRI